MAKKKAAKKPAAKKKKKSKAGGKKAPVKGASKKKIKKKGKPTTKRAPLRIVNDEHGGKEALVNKLVDMLDRGDESKDEFRDRLLAAANRKLLRLHATMTEIKQRFSSVDKMVDSLLQLMGKSKDGDYRERLLTDTPVKLLGLHHEWGAAGQKKPSRRAASASGCGPPRRRPPEPPLAEFGAIVGQSRADRRSRGPRGRRAPRRCGR